MKKNLLILSLLLAVIASCKQTILWNYGITRPKKETPESLIAFLKKMGQSPENVYIFRDSAAYFTCFRDPTFNQNLITASFYTRAGLVDEFKDTAYCQRAGEHYARILNNEKAYHVDSSCHFQEMLKNFVPLSPDPDGFDPEFNFLALVTWCKFMGKLNERQFCIDKAAGENPLARIKVLFLNIDAMRSWNLKKDQLPVIR